MKKILSCLFLILPFVGMSQKYAFQSYSTEEGLPQTQVTAFCEDDDGYLWVGTLGGLAKFNGREFATFSPKDGLLNNRIQTLFWGSGRLWIGHDGGISYLEKDKFKSFEIESDKSREVTKIVRFSGEIIACTERGGGLFKFTGNSLKQIQFPKLEGVNERALNSIRSACVSDGFLYLATQAGILKTKDLEKFEFESGIEKCSYYGVEANNEEIYFVSHKNGIYHKELSSGKITHISKEDGLNNLRGGELDEKGILWVYSTRGVMKVSNNKVIRLVDQVSGLPVNNAVYSIYNDASGNIWIGSNGKGMFRFPGEQFKYYDRSNGFYSDIFLSGFESTNGDFYFGTLDEGVVKHSAGGQAELIHVGSNAIWATQPDVDGKNWFGTGAGLVSLDANDQVTIYTAEDGIPGYKVSAFYKVGPNEMYIGGNSGVSLYKDGEITRIGTDDFIEVGTVREFIMFKDALLFATNLGLFQYKDGVITPYKDIVTLTYCIAKDRFENIWFGTEEGLFRIKNEKIEQVELRSNPGSNYINFMSARDGKLFVGSNSGLFVLSNLNKKNPSIKRYGLSEGIVDLETNLGSGFFDRKGNYWFGTASGLVCFDTHAESIKSGLPNVQLKSILLNYEAFDYTTYSKELDKKGFPKFLSLPYAKNNLIFELDGISLSNDRGLSYQFLLEGLSDTWSPLSTNSIITFTSLDAGDYVLHMRAVDVDGLVSKEVVIPFVIHPAFYKTWWFVSLCVLGVTGLVILFFRFRLRRINEANEKEKLEFKSRLLSLEQQSMNASMNRHFVFNSLNSIQYFINTRDRLSANKYLTNFAKLIRKNLDTATVDGNMITLDEELERIELYLSLESMRFKDRFDYELNADGIETDAILIPAMILQPFVENSIIHGILPNLEKKGHIVLDVKEENGYLLLSVEDNGIGVNHSMTNKVDMDGDHRSKGMEITSKRIDLIQKISNNDISLVGPYEMYNDDRSVKGTRVLLKIPLSNLDN